MTCFNKKNTEEKNEKTTALQERTRVPVVCFLHVYFLHVCFDRWLHANTFLFFIVCLHQEVKYLQDKVDQLEKVPVSDDRLPCFPPAA